MEKRAVTMRIYGRVQGVGFRYYTQNEAVARQISGWIRNMPDGSVYIEAEGDKEQLEQFINWCETGPQWARVTDVEKQYVPLKGYSGFEIR